MGRFYRLFRCRRTAFCAAFFVAAAFVFAAFHARAADDDAFTVTGVRVDVTAESALAAREQAFDKAQTDAFTELADRMLPDSQAESFTPPDPATISGMVRDFEITDEHLSNVRYVGTYTFRFRGDAVRHFLGAQGVSYTDVRSKPVLILPYFQKGAQTVLWGGDNPWLSAWNGSQSSRGLVPVVVPIGDLQDVSDMGDNDALSYDAQKLASMTARYAAGEAIILLAIPEWEGGRQAGGGDRAADSLVIMAYRTDRGSAEYANKLTITPEDAADSESLYAAGVKKSRQMLQKAWKNQTLVKGEQTGRVRARVRFGTMQEWVETQQKLRRVQGVSDMKLLSLTQSEAGIELVFQGTEERLRLALAQADMTLAPSPYGGYGGGVYDLYLNKYRQN